MATLNLTPLHLQGYQYLLQVASRGEPCPSNARIADQFGRSTGWAQTLLEMLVRDGYIRIYAYKVVRKIEIVATGDITAISRGDPNRQLFEVKYKKAINYEGHGPLRYDPADPSTVPPGAVLVDRDPCPKCGVRRDFGCSHMRSVAA